MLARGGGSVEDLLPFSDERLVRAVAAASTPIVSAIGHEGDSPIVDLAADLRASTPTDAAKRIVPDVAEENAGLRDAVARGRRSLELRLQRAEDELRSLTTRPALARPYEMVTVREQDIRSLRTWLRSHVTQRIDRAESEVSALLSQTRALSPLATLGRGYSILLDEQGRVISDAAETAPGDRLTGVLASGRLTLNVHTIVQGDHDE
ncbi:exodeoxyribonuclease VII large subunit [Actinobaculum sp. 313]|uniref:exodeoxyribonuclease VII large subunit n=1 Tax=Actinobaculum sp. 313 TaxID=2495645 RepID=UPI0023E81AE1|nr:exodeoxyribonuclease VII large subunit [Actinobaculum sp. 313]